MAKITNNKQMIERGNVDYMRSQMDTYTQNIENSKKVQDSVNNTVIRARKYSIEKETETKLKRAIRAGGVDPYDNTPGGTKIPKDKLMSLSNSAYTSTLLEKILKASDNTQFQNTSLKFQEQALNYMQTISADIKTIAETLKPKEGPQKEEEDNELNMEMSGLAKALSGLDIEGIAKEIGKSIYNKMDSGGYGDLIKTMYQSLRDTIQGGEFSQMVKGMIQNTMLSQLPKAWQANIQQFRDDPVKLMQIQLNRLGRSDNAVIRDIFGSFIRKERPDDTLKEKKVDLSAKAMFDNKFYMSVTKVIPEQLYRIVAALEGHEIRAFDWDKQDYLTATEIWAKSMQNNKYSNPEALQRKVMDIFSYSFEQMADSPTAGNLKSLFQLTADGKIDKEQVTGHVKFRNQRMKTVLTQMIRSGIPLDDLQFASPERILKELDVHWKDESERGRFLEDIYNVQRMLRTIDFDDRTDLVTDVSDFRQEIHNKFRDNTADFLTAEEQNIRARILYNDNLSADQKKDLLKTLNQKGIHVWGDGIGGTGSGGSGSGNRRGGGPNKPMFGPTTNTNFNSMMNALNTATSGELTPKQLDEARTLLDDFANGKMSNRNKNDKIKPLNDRDKYVAKLQDMYGMGAITQAQFEAFSRVETADALSQSDAEVFKKGGVKIAAAYKLYGILTDAGYTAEARAAQFGISVQEAKAQGYISQPWELMKVLNDDGSVNTSRMERFNMKYLSEDGLKALEKYGRQKQRGVLGNGSIDQQISKTLTGIFGDPKIANKAGMALGGAAGLGVHRLLKSAGLLQDPKFGWILGGVGASLMTMERSRNFMNDIFGPAGDVKGANGYTNKEIFMAKAMTKYLPMVGVGGKTAQYILKATSAFGPFGKVLGFIPAMLGGLIVGKAASSALGAARDWLFNPDVDKNSKRGKLASFLKEIPGVKKLFALSDDRIDEELILDSLKRTLSLYQSKHAEVKATIGPNAEGYREQIKALEKAIKEIEPLVKIIKSELEKEKDDKEDAEGPNQDKIDKARIKINEKLAELNNALGEEGTRDRVRIYEELEEERDKQNRMRAAADQDYNKMGEEDRTKVNEIIAEYYGANDEHKASFREFVSGEGDSILDSIQDKGLRDRLDTIISLQTAGEDMSREYAEWLQDFKAKSPDDYEAFMEATAPGSKRGAAMRAIVDNITQYLVDNGRYKDDTTTRIEAERLMMQSLNSKGLGRMFIDNFGSTASDMFARFQGKINGVDQDDVQAELHNRNTIDALNNKLKADKDAKDREYQAIGEDEARIAKLMENFVEDPEEAYKMAMAIERQRKMQPHMFDFIQNLAKNFSRKENLTDRNITKFWNSWYNGSDVNSKDFTRAEIRDIKELYKRYLRDGDLEEYREDEGVKGSGGRGTEPVKMKQMSRLKFSNGESLGVAGCSVAALTNALVYMGIDAPEPDTLIGIANQYLGPNGGVTSDFFKDVCSRLGISVSIFNSKQNTFTVDTFRQFKVGKDNGLIVLLKNQFNSGYHFITVKSITGRNLVIDDPETVGVQQVTAAEIISRAVEIISLKAQNQSAAVTSEEGAKPSQFINPNAKKTVSGTIKSSIKNAVSNKIADMASNAISKATGVATTVGSKWNDLINALSKAVFNVRIVDDYTLPLKMDDKEAALAVSRMQTAAASAGGLGPFTKIIKKYMQNKDVQNEMEESDLVQEAIINGGLVAGGSTGAAGRGTAGGAVARENNRGGVLTGNEKPAGSKWSPADMLASVYAVAQGGLGALPILGQGMLFKHVTSRLFKGAKNKGMQFFGNLFGKISDEDRENEYDEDGKLIKRKKWRDISGSLRNLKDGVNLAKAGLMAHGGLAKLVKGGADLLAKHGKKAGLAAADALTGSGGKGVLRGIINILNNVFVEAPSRIYDMLAKNKKIADIIGGTSLFKGMLDALLSGLTKAGQALMKVIPSKFVQKAGSTIVGGVGGIFKKLAKKIPGAAALMAVIRAPFSFRDGYTHAAEYLLKNKDAPVSGVEKLKVGAAKLIYDCLPDFLTGFAGVAHPGIALAGDIFTAIVRSFITFDKCLAWMGLTNGREWKGNDEEKAIAEASDQMDKFTASGISKSHYTKNAVNIQSTQFTADHEGFRSRVYKDEYGNPTIGYGFNLKSGRFTQEEVDRWTNEGISKEEAMQVLEREHKFTRDSLVKYDWFNKLDPVRQGAIVDMAYNMGLGTPGGSDGLLSFNNMISALKKGDYDTAAKEVLNSKYANDTKGRAIEIANLIRFGANAFSDSATRPARITNGDWLFPSGYSEQVVTSTFGYRNTNIPGASKDHMGLDLRARRGTPVYAAKDGVVKRTDFAYNLIEIDHGDGTTSRYLHNDGIMVKEGDTVKKGQQIAVAGNKNILGKDDKIMLPHLHFEILKNGKHVDPFIELGLSKNHLKKDSAENKAYMIQNPWINNQAKSVVNTTLPKPDNSKPVENREAGGPAFNDTSYHRSSSNNQTIINRDSQLERYVASLDAKFSQMIDLLSKLVNISQENINNVLSDAIAPARI